MAAACFRSLRDAAEGNPGALADGYLLRKAGMQWSHP